MSSTTSPVDVKAAEERLVRFLAVEGLAGQEKAVGEAVIAELRKAGVPASATRFDTVNKRIPAAMGFNVDSKVAAKQMARRRRVEQARTELRQRLVRAQEEEHRRIARELHDDLTQRLAVIAIEVGKLEQAPGHGGDVAERARGIREQLVALSESVHSLSRQLHPSILDDLGLMEALGSVCSSLRQRDGVTVNYHAQNVPPYLPRDVALCIYRVAQEALRNVAP